jgi:lysosomal acid lipase/cholesteryl ester hydrolase
MDEFAFHDIPDTIAYILDTTHQESLSYIGFSQGTAQAFATLAIHPKLNNQVNVFIALAPAMAPAGLSNGVVDSLVKASPQVLFLLFGRRSILSSATMWETLLYPPLFSRVIDMGLSFLFNWQTKNISASQKLAAYPHLYSFTSTKSVVHWFQIIRNRSFQMYDDDVHQPMSVSTTNKFSKVAKYPTRNIRTPVVLVYGGSDSLVDIRAMLRELPPQTVATEIPHYEHLDFLWARDVDAQVFQHVFDALDSFTDAEHTKEEYDRYFTIRQESLIGSGFMQGQPSRGSESDTSTIAVADTSVAMRNGGSPHANQHRATESNNGSLKANHVKKVRLEDAPRSIQDPSTISFSSSPPPPPTTVTPVSAFSNVPPPPSSSSPTSHPTSHPTAFKDVDSPIAAGKLKGMGVRRGSASSILSFDSMRDGRGISLGLGKTAASNIVTRSGGVGDISSATSSSIGGVGGGGGGGSNLSSTATTSGSLHSVHERSKGLVSGHKRHE